jgi:pyridoxine 5-phosphate synthase
MPGEKTSSRGWSGQDNQQALRDCIAFFEGKTRISVFCDATEESVTLAAEAGAQAVEFYTGDYARQFALGQADSVLAQLKHAAAIAQAANMRVHGGHDLNTENLALYLQTVPTHEVSIGHAITAEALFKGLAPVLKDYLRVIAAASAG